MNKEPLQKGASCTTTIVTKNAAKLRKHKKCNAISLRLNFDLPLKEGFLTEYFSLPEAIGSFSPVFKWLFSINNIVLHTGSISKQAIEEEQSRSFYYGFFFNLKSNIQ